MIRCSFLFVLVGIFLTAPLGAQISDPEARERALLPDPPADFLLDHGQIFERHPERKQALAERLQNFAAEHDLPIYVVVYAGLIDSTLPRRARLLYDKWIGPDRDGVVLVFNSDTRSHELLTPRQGHASLRDGTGRVTRLADYNLIPILAELRVTLEGIEDRLDYLDRSTEILCIRLGQVLATKPAGITDRSVLKLGAFTLGLGLVLTLLGIFANRRLRRADQRARERFYFPEVTVGVRLGAPFCGGRLSVVEFSRSPQGTAK